MPLKAKQETIDEPPAPEMPDDPTEGLRNPDAEIRRNAVRALGGDDRAPALIADLLQTETDHSVRTFAFAALSSAGGKEGLEVLTSFLRVDDAGLRNGAIGALRSHTEEGAPLLKEMLADSDPDVRMMAVDTLYSLDHPNAAEWIAAMLEAEEVENVVGVAIDRLSEIGSGAQQSAIQQARLRFAQVPYIAFACDAALSAIGNNP